MINKENNSNEQPETKKESGYTDTAKMDVNAHILIKDKDTGKILVNKRG